MRDCPRAREGRCRARGDADLSVLDNPVWWSLTGPQRHLAQTHGRAVRYRCDVSVFSAVVEFDGDTWDDLAHLAGTAREVGLLRDEIPPLPDGWVELLRGRGQQMLIGPDGLGAVESFPIRELTEDDLPQMLELVELTIPGPFLARTIETGTYYGHHDGDRLIAMAGQRFRAGGFTEVSAVCTDPRYRSHGLGSAITHHVASRILERGDQPFLHVADSNETARRVYERLGWVSRRSMEFMAARPPA